MVEEYLINDEIFEFITITAQTGILGFILYKLIKTAVESTPGFAKNLRCSILTLRAFYLVIATALITNMILGMLSDDYFDCKHVEYNYNWYITQAINTLMCYLNVIFGIIVFAKREQNPFDDTEFNVSAQDFRRIKLQMNILIYGYAVISTLSTLWFVAFPFIFKPTDIYCEEHPSYWVPHDELAGFYALLKTILLVSPTIIIWL